MRGIALVFLLLVFFTSCDDGDIIVTTFEFEEETFVMCDGGRSKVLYHINNEGVHETLTVRITNPGFSQNDQQFISVPDSLRLPLPNTALTPINIPLSGNNEIVYRTYDGPVPTDYFCQAIPPSSPRVLQEYRSVGGNITIRTNRVFNVTGNRLDHDGDGIPSAEEGMATNQDTDGDGIPDYLDRDDDGDNVLTSVELSPDSTTGEYLDTDEDGIPNYLDPDDDGDEVPTRFEVTENQLDPRLNVGEDGITPWYLDRFITNRYDGEVPDRFETTINNIPIRYESFVEVQNLKLRNTGGDGEEISFVSKNLGRFITTTAIPTLIKPAE